MKYIKSLIPTALLAIGFVASSCDDQKMEWYNDPSKGDVTVNEIPLKYDEKLALYKSLREYNKENILLGCGIDLTNYMEEPTYKALVDENYDAITVGYHMKHGAMVTSDGSLNFKSVDALMNVLPANMDVFGHTLAWHSNQNGGYLRGLIAPTVIPGPAGSNLLTNGDFEDDLTGWGSWGSGKESVEVSTDVKLDGQKAMKAVTSSGASQYWDLQVKSPDVATVAGHQYEISFYIKSEGDGEVRLSFNGMSNGYPWVDGAVTAPTGSTWKQITYNTTTTGSEFTASGTTMSFQIDLGGVPNMTYYIDNVRVVDLDAEDGPQNLISNGGFESGDFTNWTPQNQGAGMSVTTDDKTEGTHSAKLISSSTSANEWDLQLISDEIAVTVGTTYELSFYIRSNTDGKGRLSFAGLSNNYPWINWDGTGASAAFTTNTTWKQIKFNITADSESKIKINFDLGHLPDVTYYLDDVKLVDASASTKSAKGMLKSGPITIEKSPEEKAEIIDAAMKQWITDMVGHYKARVQDWDVVNEPIGDNGSLRTGDGNGDSGDTFHWQDFMGKDYAVKAFKYAKEAGANGVLFMNDYSLESNTKKLDGFLDYVNYIESQGVTIQGLGTQMHVRVGYTTKEGIDNMFQKMAATGKLIKVSELDVQVGTSTPSAEQLTEQSDMYQYVIESYLKNVPASQRYGLTIWGVTDEFSWIEDEALSIWDKDYARKPAYKGVADGLYGEDASANWTYEDIVNANKDE